MSVEPPNLLNEKSVRSVLRDWRSLKALGQSPLTGLECVAAYHKAAGLAANSAGRGLAVQKVLQHAVEALKPEDAPPDPKDRRWRAYIILTEQFLHGRSPEAVREQLFISRGAYYGEQKKALEMLLAALQAQEMQTTSPIGMPTPPCMAAPCMAPPRMARRLIGRAADLRQIKVALLRPQGCTTLALRGLPGVGKTTLAVELAYDPEIRARFEDGILWAGLGCRPPSPLTLLGGWAEALGIPADVTAARTDLRERAALLHAAIGERRLLLIIDDAWQEDAALALQVGGPNCAHLVTTRLPEVALSFAGADVVQVHELGPQAGLELLAEISPAAVAADRDQAHHLVKTVGGLPLALILAGKYLQKQSHSAQPRRLKDAIHKLQTGEARLQLNQIDPPLETNPNFPFSTPLSLEAVIGLSDAALLPPAHQALLDLAVFPPKPNSFAEDAALAVTAAPPEVLDALVDGGLLETAAPGRYTLHQTITDYATLQGGALQGGQAAAGARLVDYALGLLAGAAKDFGMLDREMNNIFAALDVAVHQQQHRALISLILALYPFLETYGLYSLAERYLMSASAAAHELGDASRQAMIVSKLGDAEVRRGRFKEAQALLEQSLALARATGSRALEGEVLFNLGLALAYRGEVISGKAYLEECIAIQRELGDEKFEVYALNAFGFCLEEWGCYTEAKVLLEETLARSIELKERRTEGWDHYNLGTIYFSLGEYEQAQAHNEACLQIYRELGDRRGEGWIMLEKGRSFRQTGDYRRAGELFSQSLQYLGDLGDTMGVGYSLLNLGLIQMDLGEPAAAVAFYHDALAKFLQIACRPGESQVYHLLATIQRRSGELAAAKALLEKSMEVYRAFPYRRGECTHLAHLALIAALEGHAAAALEGAEQALRIADEMQAPPTQAYVLNILGRIQTEAGDWPAAQDACRRALAILRRLGQAHITVEPLAGLAEVALRTGRLDEALPLVDEALAALPWQPGCLPVGADHPLRAEWPEHTFEVCRQVFAVCGDPRAESLQAWGRAALQAWGERLPKPAM